MNKQQTAVEQIINHLIEYGFDLSLHKREIEQAKEMEAYRLTQRFEEGRELGQIEILASQATEKASTYADGYNEGYKRAFEYMIDAIKNKISPTDEP
jgi:flagellar biosynthesis/type III secretory pathway protein FliH